MVTGLRPGLLGAIVTESAWRALPAGLLLAAAVLLGGGSHSGFLADTILQLIAVVVLLSSLSQWPSGAQDRRPYLEWGFCAALLFIPALQLLPLPPALWTGLPGADYRLSALALIHREAGWAQLTLQPGNTWLSLAAFVPPLSMFLATLTLGHRERRIATMIFLAVGVFSAVIGLAQVAQGPNSPLRPYPLTNPTEAVGFFANRNHFAALINVLLPFVTVWTVRMIAKAGEEKQLRRDDWAFDAQSAIAAIVGFTVLVALLAAEAMARSRAGLGLAIVSLAACYAVTWTRKSAEDRKSRGRTSSRLVLGAISIAGLLITQFALYRILDRFEQDPLKDARVVFGERTYEAAMAYMPWGSGLGSFVSLYAAREQPQDALVDTFANHAHNDFLELWLETGILGLAALAVYVCWWVWRSYGAWRGAALGGEAIDHWLARASGFAILLLLLHSAVDYPLRTGCGMVVFAFASALLVPPLRPTPVAERVHVGSQRRERSPAPHHVAREDAPDAPWAPEKPSPVVAQAPGVPWTPDAEWPDAWTKPPEANPVTGLRHRSRRPKPPEDAN